VPEMAFLKRVFGKRIIRMDARNSGCYENNQAVSLWVKCGENGAVVEESDKGGVD